MKRVYLDNAATTPVSEEVFEAMRPYLLNHYGNPSSIHADGRKARMAIENSRKVVANYLNASLGEIFFTSCGTESNNMALKCSVRDLGIERIISSPIEHHCILHTLDSIEKHHSTEIEYLNITSNGVPDTEHLKELLTGSDKKTLVSLMHANNEIGSMISLSEISDICRMHNALFHSDTVQTIGKFPFNLQETTINFLSGSAHKLYGPKGIGFVYINNDNIINPFLDGGAQERNMRAGTENVASIVGYAKALELAINEMDSRKNKITSIRNYMIEGLKKLSPEIKIHGNLEQENLYTVLNVGFPISEKTDMLIFNLDIAGISASGGSACSSGVESVSHVIKSLYNREVTHQPVRFSFSHKNTNQEIDLTINALKKFL